MKVKQIKTGFMGVTGAFLLSALTPVLIPFATNTDGDLTGIGYAAGGMFWLGLILGIAGYIRLRWKVKEKLSETKKRSMPAALCFFSNRPAAVADVSMIIGIVITIICATNIHANEIAAIAGLALALGGIYTHFLLNGKLYHYIRNNPKG